LGSLVSAETCNLKWGKIGPKLLMTNRKLLALSIGTEINDLGPRSFISVPIESARIGCMTLKGLNGHYALFQSTPVFGAYHENLNTDKPLLSAAKM